MDIFYIQFRDGHTGQLVTGRDPVSVGDWVNVQDLDLPGDFIVTGFDEAGISIEPADVSGTNCPEDLKHVVPVERLTLRYPARYPAGALFPGQGLL